MSTSTDASTEAKTEVQDAGENGEDTNRLPYVVVRMSAAMKESLVKYAADHSIAASRLGLNLLAKEIGWDLDSDPDAPTTTSTRSKYADDAAREVGKQTNRARVTLQRKALFQAAQGQIKKRPALLAVAIEVVQATSEQKPDLATLKELDAKLTAAMEAGK